MAICPKCHKLISDSHYQRHLRRCGTSHRHQPQSLYVPSATAQIESPNRGITYGPPSSRSMRKKGRTPWFVVGVLAALVVVLLIVLDLLLPVHPI